MSPFEKYVTDGNEKADELAKEGATRDEGFMARTRAKTVQQEREKRCAQPYRMQSAFTVLVEVKNLSPKPQEKWIFVDKRREGIKHRTEWCATGDKYRCMRCGKKQQIHE